MVNFIILTIILSVILVTVIISRVLHNNDDTFDTLLRRREDVFIARGRRCMYCGNGDNSDIRHKYCFKYPDG